MVYADKLQREAKMLLGQIVAIDHKEEREALLYGIFDFVVKELKMEITENVCQQPSNDLKKL